MLPNTFDYIFVHLRQKVRLRPELSPKFLSTLGPNPIRTQLRKPGPTYNFVTKTSNIRISQPRVKGISYICSTSF